MAGDNNNQKNSSNNNNADSATPSHALAADPFSEAATDESLARYAAYGARLRTVAFAARRYLAYSSDFGEAFRPVVPASAVRAAYGISWLYVSYDVLAEGKHVNDRGATPTEVGLSMSQRLTFQVLASMALPAFTIHTQVRLASSVFRRLGRFQKWGPTLAGLALMPALPYMFDHPVETLVEEVFDAIRHEVLPGGKRGTTSTRTESPEDNQTTKS